MSNIVLLLKSEIIKEYRSRVIQGMLAIKSVKLAEFSREIQLTCHCLANKEL